MQRTTTARVLAAGFAGACVLTLAHELTRAFVRSAPRLDLIGMRAMRRGLERAGLHSPGGKQLRGLTLAGDLVANGLYFAPIALRPRRPWLTATALGLTAGLGTVTLPPRLG
jgi:hypothetical protein